MEVPRKLPLWAPQHFLLKRNIKKYWKMPPCTHDCCTNMITFSNNCRLLHQCLILYCVETPINAKYCVETPINAKYCVETPINAKFCVETPINAKYCVETP